MRELVALLAALWVVSAAVVTDAGAVERYERVGAAAVILGLLITRPGPPSVVSSDLATVSDGDGNAWEVRRHPDQQCKFGLLGPGKLVGEVDFSQLTGRYLVAPRGHYVKLVFHGIGRSAGYCFRAPEGDYRCFNDLILSPITEAQARAMLGAAEFMFADGCRAEPRPY